MLGEAPDGVRAREGKTPAIKAIAGGEETAPED